jgi:hypothetical protein
LGPEARRGTPVDFGVLTIANVVASPPNESEARTGILLLGFDIL